jgi:hypothetical protein
VSAYEWTQVTDKAAFSGRDGAGALVYRDKMWLIGGWNPWDKDTNPIHSDCNNEVWCSENGAEWTLVKANTHLDSTFDPSSDWEARHTAGYVVYQDKMWIVGGDPLLGHYQPDVWNSEDGKTWNWVNKGKDAPWGSRTLHYTVVFQDKIWVMGGQTLPQFAPAEHRFYNDIWNSSDGIHWDKVETHESMWSPRGMIGGSVVLNDRIWLLSGGIYDTPDRPQWEMHAEVWSSADGQNWECATDSPPWRPRHYHDTAAFDGRMWILGGCVPRNDEDEGKQHGENAKDVWHSTDGVHWEEVPNTPWAARHASSTFVFQDALWMIAGNHMDSDVWKLISK